MRTPFAVVSRDFHHGPAQRSGATYFDQGARKIKEGPTLLTAPCGNQNNPSRASVKLRLQEAIPREVRS